MDCDECIERVFELIDEEASDPERVRAILDRCPDCRALFEETKATSALASELPLDEPPAERDAAILRAAGKKIAPNRKPRRPWAPRAPHWAMAAVAVLAIGLGMWSRRPRDIRMEDELPAAYELEARLNEDELSAVTAEEAPARELAEAAADDPAAMKASAAHAPQAAPAEANVDLAERAAPGLATAGGSEASGVRSEAKRERSERAVSKTAPAAPAAAAVEPKAALADIQAADADAASPASAQAAERLEEASLRACRELVATQARRDDRAGKDSGAATEPVEAEAQLRLGRCYRQLGDHERALLWLERAKKQPATRERASAELQALTAESK